MGNLNSRQIAETFMNAFYREHKDFDTIAGLLAAEFRFTALMATFSGPGPLMAFLREIGPQKNRIEIRRLVAEGGDVAVCHSSSSATPVIGPLPFSEGYTLKSAKIVSRILFFDAREFAPWIEQQMRV